MWLPVKVAAAGAVSALGYTAVETTGVIGGLVFSAIAALGVIYSFFRGRAEARERYDTAIREAERRGRESVLDELREARREAAEYQQRYLNLLERGRRPSRREEA